MHKFKNMVCVFCFSAHAEDVAAAANLAASEASTNSALNDDPKSSNLAPESSDLSSTLFGQPFDQQSYDSCTFPTITLQASCCLPFSLLILSNQFKHAYELQLCLVGPSHSRVIN